MHSTGPRAVLARVLANPSLRRVLFSYLAFHIAEFATWVAILLFAYAATGPASVGVVALIQLVPAALVAAPAASLGDRYPRERVLSLGYLVQALAMLATFATMAVGAPIPVVYLAAAVAASSLVVTRPTQSALLPSLARTPDELTAANGAAGVVEGVGVLIGPLLAALIVASQPVSVVYLVAAAALVVAALSTFGLRPVGGLAALGPDTDPATGIALDATPTDDGGVLAGLRAVGADADARLVVGLLTARTLMVGCADVLFVLMALELLGMGEPGAGLLNAALGAGTIVGGALTFALVGRESLARVAAAGTVLWGGALALIALTATPAAAIGFVLAGGAGLAIVDVAGRTLLQRTVRDEVLSRVFGLQEGLAMGALAAGSILVSFLTETVGLTAAIGAVALILPAVVAFSWTRITAMDAKAVVPMRAIALLRRTPLFAPLPLPQLESVARRGVWLTYPSQTAIITEGEVGDRYYVLASGVVRVDQGGQFLRELSGPGAGFGEIALLRDVPRTASVTSASEVAVFAIDRAPFLAAITGHPDAYASAERRADTLIGTRPT